MKQVTIDTVKARIAEMENIQNTTTIGISLREEFELACLRKLLASLEAKPVVYSLIFRNMEAELNDYVNANTTVASLEKAQAYGKGGRYVRQDDGSCEWVPDPSLDPVVVPLYVEAPAQEVYNIGEATMLHIFTATGMTDVSDMQAVFDRVEKALVKLERKPKVIEPDGWRDMMARLANGLELMTSLASERAISVDTCVCLEWVRDARAMLAAGQQGVK